MLRKQTNSTLPWDILPFDAKSNVTRFLTNREISLFSRVNHTEYDTNRYIYICQQLTRNPDQIINTDDLSEALAQLLKVNPDDIKNSERFESTIIHFIRKLDAEQVPFLKPDTNVANHASYMLSHDRVAFQYRQFAKKQSITMATVLEQFFVGIKSRVSQIEKNAPYWITCDKNAFLQKILPCVFNVKENPKKQIQFEEPEVLDWAPEKLCFVVRKDGASFTDADRELISQKNTRRI